MQQIQGQYRGGTGAGATALRWTCRASAAALVAPAPVPQHAETSTGVGPTQVLHLDRNEYRTPTEAGTQPGPKGDRQ